MKSIKEQYPPETRLSLIEMNAPYRPVEPGTPVYVVERCNCTVHYREHCLTLQGRPKGNAKAIAVMPCEPKPKATSAFCWKIFIRPFDPAKHLKKWGTKVFETEEQARNTILEAI